MKTAISIPDTLYHSADALAERLGTSRSQLYSQAIELYVSEHATDQVTETLNEVYARAEPSDTKLALLQSLSLTEGDW